MIVSNDARNIVSARTRRGTVTMIPFTSNTETVLGFQVFIPADEHNGLSVDSKAQTEQVRALDYSRYVSRQGSLSTEQMAAVDEALRVHLDLE